MPNWCSNTQSHESGPCYQVGGLPTNSVQEDG